MYMLMLFINYATRLVLSFTLLHLFLCSSTPSCHKRSLSTLLSISTQFPITGLSLLLSARHFMEKSTNTVIWFDAIPHGKSFEISFKIETTRGEYESSIMSPFISYPITDRRLLHISVAIPCMIFIAFLYLWATTPGNISLFSKSLIRQSWNLLLRLIFDKVCVAI